MPVTNARAERCRSAALRLHLLLFATHSMTRFRAPNHFMAAWPAYLELELVVNGHTLTTAALSATSIPTISAAFA